MLQIKEKKVRQKNPTLETALKDYVTGKGTVAFAEVRTNVPELVGATDGEIHQLALDAGYDVE